jgi:hypothetical protein
MDQEITWTVSNGGNVDTKKLQYVSAWKTFNKQPEEDKERLFNEMRAQLILTGLMERN